MSSRDRKRKKRDKALRVILSGLLLTSALVFFSLAIKMTFQSGWTLPVLSYGLLSWGLMFVSGCLFAPIYQESKNRLKAGK